MKKADRALKRTLAAAGIALLRHSSRRGLLQTTALQAVAVAAVFTMPMQARPAYAQLAPTARPSGGQVVAGSASIGQTTAQTTVSQTTNRAAVNWQSFDVGSAHTVDFVQPSSSSVTLNRVVGPHPSEIAGRITANGSIVVVNQAGVVFDRGAVVDTGGLAVSAAGISNSNFMAGRMIFDQPANPGAKIENRGTISIKDRGLASLVAPRVANSGVIRANLGTVILAGAEAYRLDLYGDGMLGINVTKQVTSAPDGTKALVTNDGVISARGGAVLLTAEAVDGVVQTLVNAGGTISANTASGRAGRVVVSGRGGDVVVTGSILTEGLKAGQSGGSVEVNTTDAVRIAAGARISASGKAGGGTVALGTTLARAAGGPTVSRQKTAKVTGVAKGATVTANATAKGKGGIVTVLSTESTSLAGLITAKGGPAGGDGGLVEVSGTKGFALTGSVDVSAPKGKAGSILLDPDTLDIVHDTSASGTEDAHLPTVAATDGAAGTPDTVTDFALQSLTGNVTLAAHSTISVQTGVTLTTDTSLQLLTEVGNININTGGSITTSGTGSIALLAGTVAGSGGQLLMNADLVTGAGGSVLLSADGGIVLNSAHVTTGVLTLGNATSLGVTQTGTGMISANTLNSLGTIAGGLTLAGTANAVASLGAVNVTGGDFTLVNTGSLSVSGPVSAPNMTLTAGTIGIPGILNAATVLALGASSGGIAEPATGTVSAGTLASVGTIVGGMTLAGTANSIGTLGTVAVTGGDLSLVDTGTLSVSGPVSAPNITLTAGTIGIPGILNAATVLALGASSGGIAEPATGTVSAGTLASVGTIVGGMTLAGTANSIGTLGTVAVTGGDLSLVDTGSLSVSGPVSAPNITLTAGTIGIPGILNATTVLALGASSGGIAELATGTVSAGTLASVGTIVGGMTLAGTANSIGTLGTVAVTGGDLSLVDTGTLSVSGPVSAPNITLTAGTIGIPGILNAATVLALGASSGGIAEPATGTVSAGTLASVGTIVGGMTLAGTANSIGTFGTVAVTGGDLSLVDTGTLSVSGPVSAPNITLTAGTIGIPGILNATTVLALGASSGGIAEPATGSINAGTLTSVGTIAGDVSLAGTANAIGTLASFLMSYGDLTLFDGSDLSVVGPVVARDVFLAISAAGGTMALGSATITATDTTSPRITLVSDRFTATTPSISTPNGGAVEVAPYTPGTAFDLGSGAAALPNAVLAGINTGTTAGSAAGTVLIGGYTPPMGTLTATAGDMTLTGTIDFGTIAPTLQLMSLGGIVQNGTDALTGLGTLAATSTLLALGGAANAISSLARIDVGAGGTLTLVDSMAETLAGTLTAGSLSITAADLTLGAGAVLNVGTLLTLTTTTGDIHQAAAGGTLSLATGTLTIDSHGSVSLLNPTNKVGTLGNMTALGDLVIVVDPSTLTVTGTQTAANILIEASGAGDTLLLSNASLTATAASNPRISLIADSINEVGANILVATGGSVELSPLTATVAVSLGGSSGLVLDNALLGAISTGTVVVGGYTDTPNGATSAAAQSSGISFDGVVDLRTGGNAAALNLLTSGAVTQTSGTLAVDTLLGNTGSTVSLTAAGNTVGTLGAFSVAAGTLALTTSPGTLLVVNDAVSAGSIALTAGTLTVAGSGSIIATDAGAGVASLVATTGGLTQKGQISGQRIVQTASAGSIGHAGTALAGAGGATLTAIGTGSSIAVSGSIGASGAGTVGLLSGNGGITLNGGTLAGHAITLDGNGGAITLASGGVLSTTALTVATSSGGVSENSDASINAGTLSGTVAGGVTLAGTANTIASLGSLAVTGGNLSVLDTGTLAVAGAVGAPNITLAAGTIGIPGILNATTVLALGASSGGISEPGTGTIGAGTVTSVGTIVGGMTLAGTANTIGSLGTVTVSGGSLRLVDTGSLTVSGPVSAPNITLTAGTIGIPGILNAATVLALGASSGGIAEPATGSINAGTLTSVGTIAGDVSLAGTANAIGTLASFLMSYGDLTLFDGLDLSVVGPVVARDVFLAISAAGGTMALGSATITATDTTSPRITLVSDRFTATTPSISTPKGGMVELAPYTAGLFSAGGTASAVPGTLIRGINTGTIGGTAAGTLVIGGYTQPNGTPLTTAGDMTLAGSLDFSTIAPNLQLLATGTISQATSRAVVGLGTLSVTADTVALNGTTNAFQNLSASSVTNTLALTDTDDLTLVGTITGATVSLAAKSLTVGASGVLTAGTLLSLTTTGGDVRETVSGSLNSGGQINAGTLTINSAGSIALLNPGNTAGTLTNLRAVNDLALVAGSATLATTGTVSAANIFIEASGAGDTLALNGATIQSTGTTNPRVALIADHITDSGTNLISTTGGSVEVAPLTGGNTVSLAGTTGLALDTPLLAALNTGSLVVGVFTDMAHGGIPTTTAGLIRLDGAVDLKTAHNAAFLDLYSNGKVTQTAGSLLVDTLLGNTGSTVSLGQSGNAVGTLAGFTVAAGTFSLTGTTGGTLLVAGPVSAGNVTIVAGTVTVPGAGNVSATTAAAITANTGTLTQAGTVNAGTSATLIGAAGLTHSGTTKVTAGPATLQASANTLTQSGTVTATTITETATTGDIAHTGTSLARTGGGTLVAGGSITQTGGTIRATNGNLMLMAGSSIIQTGGTIQTAGTAAGRVLALQSNGTLTGDGILQSVSSPDGLIQSSGPSGTVTVTSANLITLNGTVQATDPAGVVTVSAAGAAVSGGTTSLLQAGLVSAGGTLTENAIQGDISLTSLGISQAGAGGFHMLISGGSLQDQGGAITAAGGNVDIVAGAAVVQNGGQISTTGSVATSISIAAQGTTATNGIFQDQNGLIQASDTLGTVTLTAASAISTAGQVLATDPSAGTVAITAHGSGLTSTDTVLAQNGLVIGGLSVSEIAILGSLVHSGTSQAGNGGLTVTAGDGSITATGGQMAALNSGTVALTASQGSVTLNGAMPTITAVDGGISLQAGASILMSSGTILTTGTGGIGLTSYGETPGNGITQAAGSIIRTPTDSAAAITLTAANTITVAGEVNGGAVTPSVGRVDILAGGTEFVTGGSTSTGNALTVAGTGIVTAGTLTETATRGDILHLGRSEAGAGGATLAATDGSITQNGGTIQVTGGRVGLTAAVNANDASSGAITQTSGLILSIGGDSTLIAGTAITQSAGTIGAQDGNVGLAAGTSVMQAGSILAMGPNASITVTANGSAPGQGIVQAATGVLQASDTLGTVTLTSANSVSLDGLVQASDPAGGTVIATAQAGTLTQSGTVIAGALAALTAQTGLTNSGTTTVTGANGAATLVTATGDLSNSGAVTANGAGARITETAVAGNIASSGITDAGSGGVTLSAAAAFNQTAGLIRSAGPLDVTANTYVQSGTVMATGDNVATLGIGVGGITVNSGALLSAGTVDLSATGGGVSAPGGTINADVLRSTSNVTGTADLSDPANTVGSLGNLAVLGGDLILGDRADLTVTGTVSAASGTVTVNGYNASAIGVTGSITGQAMTLTSGSGGVSLTGATLRAPSVSLNGGGGAVVLQDGAQIGQPGAYIALGTGGNGMTEDASSTLTGATLVSLGTVGGNVSLAGRANAIDTLADFNVAPGGNLTFNDATLLHTAGTISADNVTLFAVGLTQSATALLRANAASGSEILINPYTTLSIDNASASGNISLNGANSAATVQVRSGDRVVVDGTLDRLGATGLSRKVRLPNLRAFPDVTNPLTPGLLVNANSTVVKSSLRVTGAPDLTFKIADTGTLEILGLQAPASGLWLDLGRGFASGIINVAGLHVDYSSTGNAGRVEFLGRVNGQDGYAAASNSYILPLQKNNYLVNGCPIQSLNCVRITVMTVPVTNPLEDLDVGLPTPPSDSLMTLPDVAEQDY